MLARSHVEYPNVLLQQGAFLASFKRANRIAACIWRIPTKAINKASPSIRTHQTESHFLGKLIKDWLNHHEGLKVSLNSYFPPTIASEKLRLLRKLQPVLQPPPIFTYIIASFSGVTGHRFRFTDGWAFLLQLLSDHLSDLLKKTMLNSFILQDDHTSDKNSLPCHFSSAGSWRSDRLRF